MRKGSEDDEVEAGTMTKRAKFLQPFQLSKHLNPFVTPSTVLRLKSVPTPMG